MHDYRDLGSFYLRKVRELDLAPVDIVGFLPAAISPRRWWLPAKSPSAMILVAPLGLRPLDREIFDFFAVTARSHLAATDFRHDAPDVAAIYAGEMISEQFLLCEAARAETSRLGWEPFMFSPSLANRLDGVRHVRSLIVWGDEDGIVPRGCITAYEHALHGARVEIIGGCGHRPEIEAPDEFVKHVDGFLTVSTEGV